MDRPFCRAFVRAGSATIAPRIYVPISGGGMKSYNAIGAAIIALYALGCACRACGDRPLLGLVIGAVILSPAGSWPASIRRRAAFGIAPRARFQTLVQGPSPRQHVRHLSDRPTG